VKWHPKQEDTMAVASETALYLLNVTEASQVFGGEPISQMELQRIGQNISMPSVSKQHRTAGIFTSMFPSATRRV